MNDNTPDPFELIRRETLPEEPSDKDYQRGRQRLSEAITSEKQKRQRRARGWLVPSLAIALVVVIVGGIALIRPSPAEAALTDIAEAARQATPLEVPQGSFIYTRSERADLTIRPGTEFELDQESVAYLLPSTREVWRQPETDFIQIRTIKHTPTFFDPALEDIYYRLRLDVTDRLGESQTEQLTGAADPLLTIDWPTEPDVLDQALRDYDSRGGDQRPENVQVFDLATDLLREADPSPELRAAVVEVLAGLPIELVEQTNSTITIAVTYETPAPTRDTITLRETGQLVAETSTLLEADLELGLPADTTILKVDYQETRLTDEL